MDGSPPVEATASALLRHRQRRPDGTAKVDFQTPDFNGDGARHGRRVEQDKSATSS